MRQIDLPPSAYRVRDKPKVKFTFFEAASFAIGSTLATRKRTPPDPEKSATMTRAIVMGLIWYFTHPS